MKLLLPAIVLVLSAVIANGQTEVANVRSPAPKNAATTNVPVYRDYRGVTIGMSADEVRAKLNRIKKGQHQDLLTLSEHESAQIYYDDKGKVTAISIDYFGDARRRIASRASAPASMRT